jgi:hypothetical protein
MENRSKSLGTKPDASEVHTAILAVLAECGAELVDAVEHNDSKIETYCVDDREIEVIRSFSYDANGKRQLREVSVRLSMTRIATTTYLTNAILAYFRSEPPGSRALAESRKA